MTTEMKDSDIIRIVKNDPELFKKISEIHLTVETRIKELETELIKLRAARGPSQDLENKYLSLPDKVQKVVDAVRSGNSNKRSIMSYSGLTDTQYSNAINEAVKTGLLNKNGNRSVTFYTVP